jgi:hypothetical protein
MRGSLKKPSENFSAKVQRLTPGANPQREVRAKTTAKHSQVDRFGTPKPADTAYGKEHGRVLQGELVGPPAKPTRLQSGPSSTAVALPSMVSSASHQKLERLLDAALTSADAHKQALRYQAARHFWQKPGFMGRRKALKLVLILVILLATIGVAAWEKIPQVSVKLAAIRTHLHASVPAYKPVGFSQAPASAKSGSVVIKFKSTDNVAQGFDIIQKQSNLASASLSQTLVPQGSQVQTSQVAGNTVYIYGARNDAAWVNNGVLYTIKDYAGLTSDQIIKIVQGLN